MSSFNLTDILNMRSKEGKEEPKEEAEKEVEEIVMIDVKDLIPSKENFYTVDEDLKQSIDLVGILQPLLVNRPVDGKYKVIAGHRRRLAVLALVEEGKEERRYLPCVYKRKDITDRLALLMANRFRDKTDWEKMMEAIEAEKIIIELREEFRIKGQTREMIKEAIGVSEGQMGRYKAIYNNLIPELMKEFKKNNIGISVVSEACGLSKDWQQTAVKRFEENRTLSLQDIREMKEKELSTIPGQIKIEDIADNGEEGVREGEVQKSENAEQQSESEEQAQQAAGAEGNMNQPEESEPQPETITSLCYSCIRYEDCHEKRSTVTECNTYINRTEARKTEEQRYEEEQEKIDKATKKMLKEQEEAEREEPIREGRELHNYRLPASRYEDIIKGVQRFLLLKNEKYKVGEGLNMIEHNDGIPTGRRINADITFIMSERKGLEENYCILGFRVTGTEDNKECQK